MRVHGGCARMKTMQHCMTRPLAHTHHLPCSTRRDGSAAPPRRAEPGAQPEGRFTAEPEEAGTGAHSLVVRLLGDGSPADLQASAADVLAYFADYAETSLSVTIAGAGAIPPLVRLLGAESPAEVRTSCTRGHYKL